MKSPNATAVRPVALGRGAPALPRRAAASFNTTFERSYRDGEQWKSTDSFGRDDLLLLGFIAQQCFAWIAQQPTK